MMRKRLFLATILLGALGLAGCALRLAAPAQPGAEAGVLAELPSFKSYTAARQSSYDPSGGNDDGRQDWPLKPGETRTMAKIDGAGAITHLWITIATIDPNRYKNLVLRMYWDGEKQPSVECPLGDFFGLGHGQSYQYSSLPIQIGTKESLNCFWRMPFAKGALVTVTNDGPVECGAFYYYVDYQRYKRLPDDTGRFHATYHQEFPCRADQPYLILQAKGRGHYVGCNLSVHLNARGWWGEGDDMIYVDGEREPTFKGTGSEDYFCGAWCYDGQAFSNPYFGCPLGGADMHVRGAYWNVYRYHIEDPIPFNESLKVEIEHGHANDRADNFSSVAYWYQTEPHAPLAPLPPPAERISQLTPVYLEPQAKEAEDLSELFQGGPLQRQVMQQFAEKWSGGEQLFLTPEGPATYAMTYTEENPPVNKSLVLWYTAAADYGTCELWINGARVAQWDGYLAEGVARRKLECPFTLKAGANAVELCITGKNAASKGYFAGLDCFGVK